MTNTVSPLFAHSATPTFNLPPSDSAPGPSAAPTGSSHGDPRTIANPLPPFIAHSIWASTGSTRRQFTGSAIRKRWLAEPSSSHSGPKPLIFTKCSMRWHEDRSIYRSLRAKSLAEELEGSLGGWGWKPSTSTRFIGPIPTMSWRRAGRRWPSFESRARSAGLASRISQSSK